MINKLEDNYLEENIVSKTIYVISKIDNKKYCKTNGQFTRHLCANNMAYQYYYETYITGFTPLCSCNKPLTLYQKNNEYANSCGNPQCVGKSISNAKQSWSAEQKLADSTAKKRAFMLRTPEQKAEQVIKTKETWIKKYGVEWASQSVQQREKSKKTKFERYGNSYYSNNKQATITKLHKSESEKNEINSKRRKTNMERYGVEVPALLINPSKTNKGNAMHKEYTLPSGTIISVRGFEPYALNYLIEYGYLESEIRIHNSYSQYDIEVFEYKNVNNHILKYYPDIFIEKENRIIEVKSQWWWDGNGEEKYKSRLENNLRKARAVLDKGYNYEVWIFSNKYEYKVLKDDTDFQTKQ
jgi:hypothetical protein